MDTYPTDETYSSSEEIDCPHCGEELATDLWEAFRSENVAEFDCDHCGNVIEVEREEHITYTARVKE